MKAIRSKDTKPELMVRKLLHANGFRYRLHDHSLPGRPDIVFKKYKTAIQVRGCFWHGHGCKVDHKPKSNKSYWSPKILKNIERDQKNDGLLKEQGWNVMVIWECECRDSQKFELRMREIIEELSNMKNHF